MAGTIICFLFDICFGIFDAIFAKYVLDVFTSGKYELFYTYAIILFSIMTASYINNTIYNNFFDKLINDTALKLKSKAYDRVSRLKVECFLTSQSTYFSRRLDDAEGIAFIINSAFNSITRLVTGLSYFIVLLLTSPILTLICSVFYIVKYLLSLYYVPENSALRKKYMQTYDKSVNAAIEGIRASRDVKSLNMQKHLTESYMQNTNKYFAERYATHKRWRNWSFGSGYIAGPLNTFVFMLLMGYFLMSKTYEAGALLYVYSYRNRISNLFTIIFNIKNRLAEAETHASRFMELFDDTKMPTESFGNITLEDLKGEIVFNSVSFSYKENSEVLNNLSFKIEPHKINAFVGKTGCGKSTTLALISRFYDPISGDITIDGVPIKDLDENTLRTNLSYVQQDPYIFNRTFKENLLLVNPSATDEEIEQACKKAQIHDFILTTENGYDTLIGENGITLSGGQKQRLAIARALLNNSSIIMFDESTSSLDNENQSKIQDVINNLSKEHTIIVVAHRLSTIINADKILFMEDGKIKAEGTHAELYKTCKEYKALYKLEV